MKRVVGPPNVSINTGPEPAEEEPEMEFTDRVIETLMSEIDETQLNFLQKMKTQNMASVQVIS